MEFGVDPAILSRLVSEVRKVTARPLIVKLSPNVTDIAEIARAVVEAGADAVSLINTLRGLRWSHKTDIGAGADDESSL